MKYYYDSESDEYISIEELKSIYEKYDSAEYESFSDWLTACQWYNNGSLTPIMEHIDFLKRKIALYGDEEASECYQTELDKAYKLLQKEA